MVERCKTTFLSIASFQNDEPLTSVLSVSTYFRFFHDQLLPIMCLEAIHHLKYTVHNPTISKEICISSSTQITVDMLPLRPGQKIMRNCN